jgi:preprotein translocase subunit SecD
LFNKLNCNNKNWKQQAGYTSNQYDSPTSQIVSCGQGSKYVLDKAAVLGRDVKSATATLSSTSVNWQTNLNFDSAGATAFGNITSQMFSKYGVNSVLDQLAVVLDGNVISAPVIQGAIPGGSAQITGSFTQAQATNLANVLSYGALPITFTKQSVNSVSPQLGSDQLHAGLIAGAIGLLLVIIYCLLYYRGLVQPDHRGRTGLRVGDHARQVPGLRAGTGRRGRPHRGYRHHRGLVRGVLRAAP